MVRGSADQSKKKQVKKSAKSRSIEKNEEDIEEIIHELTTEFMNKKNLLGNKATKDALKNYEIFLGKVEKAHGNLEVRLVDGRLVQVHTPGNMALHDLIKQTAQGTAQIPELQPYVLIRYPPGQKCGETLALISDTLEITNLRIERLKKAGIRVPKEELDEIFEEEIVAEDL